MKIKKHVPGRTYLCWHFFVLAVGQNTGKPSYSPWRNSFVVLAESSQEALHLYWLFFALWRGCSFKRVLRGSVIPFVPLSEVRKVVAAIYQPGAEQLQQLDGVVASLQQVEDLQERLQAQLGVARELQHVLAARFLK